MAPKRRKRPATVKESTPEPPTNVSPDDSSQVIK